MWVRVPLQSQLLLQKAKRQIIWYNDSLLKIEETLYFMYSWRIRLSLNSELIICLKWDKFFWIFSLHKTCLQILFVNTDILLKLILLFTSSWNSFETNFNSNNSKATDYETPKTKTLLEVQKQKFWIDQLFPWFL